jgi:hypothetical protein
MANLFYCNPFARLIYIFVTPRRLSVRGLRFSYLALNYAQIVSNLVLEEENINPTRLKSRYPTGLTKNFKMLICMSYFIKTYSMIGNFMLYFSVLAFHLRLTSTETGLLDEMFFFTCTGTQA